MHQPQWDEPDRDETELAFRRLREVLTAPDRRGWRRYLRRREVSGPDLVVADVSTDAPGVAGQHGLRDTDPDSRQMPPLAVLLALPLLGAAAILTISVFRPVAVDEGGAGGAASEHEMVDPSEVSTPGEHPSSSGSRIWPAEPVSVEGTIVTVGERRWVVGDPGDVVVIGDWNCDGATTPAVLRPAHGGFYVFDRWAADDEVTPARGIGKFPGATSVAAAGCGTALVTSVEGTRRVETASTLP